MKYAFILCNKLVWPISVQCRVLAVSVSGYHQHQARRRKIASRRHLSDEALLVHIRAVYAENRGAYGWPRNSTPASKSACRGPRSGGNCGQMAFAWGSDGCNGSCSRT